MEMPQRKPNRIPDYDYNNSGAYFITICTQDRKPILCDIVGDDAHIVPKACGMIAEEAIMEIPHKYPSIFVDRYIVMPDHIHMLLRINVVGEAFRLPQAQDVSVMREGTGDPSPTIGNVIGWYKYQVTKRINELQNTPGTRRFQRSYYDHVIRNQADYNEIWEYIDNNPMKWILTRNGEL